MVVAEMFPTAQPSFFYMNTMKNGTGNNYIGGDIYISGVISTRDVPVSGIIRAETDP
jgi:hypothetical protein